MKTWRIGRLVIAWGKDVSEAASLVFFLPDIQKTASMWEDILKLIAGTHHIAKNPPKGVKRKRRGDV